MFNCILSTKTTPQKYNKTLHSDSQLANETDRRTNGPIAALCFSPSVIVKQKLLTRIGVASYGALGHVASPRFRTIYF